jgi:hypothetical protein
MVEVYVQQKNMYKMFDFGCFLKVYFTWKYIKKYFFKKKLFLISAHQNDLKIQKTY